MKRNKITRRVFLIIGVAIIVSSLLSMTAAAYTEAAVSDSSQNAPESLSATTSQDTASDDSAATSQDAAMNDVGSASDNGSDMHENSEETVFTALYSEVREHLGEIMCALTFAGSVILTMLYKKGLMPFITRAVEAIGTVLGGMKESTEKNGSELGALGAALGKTETAVEKIGEHLTEIEGTLSGMKSDAGERERFKAIMDAQVNLLYDIFMNSSIPQYQKDAVGERIAEMKGALKGAEEAEG